MNTVKFILAIIVITISNSLWAYDFYAVNNGDTIYYNITSDTVPYTVEVTYKIQSDSMNYSGAIIIPSTVTYETLTYTVTSIGDNAFEACSDLTFISIPISIQTIGRYAFSSCTGLTHITIPDSVKTIGFAAFVMNTNLTTVKFNAINCNDYGIFARNNKLATLIFGENVIRIPNGLCKACEFLTTIYISNSVKIIGDQAFRFCKYLTSIHIPDSVVFIGDYAFSDCINLQYVTIGKFIDSIGDAAFENDINISEITMKGVSPPLIKEYTFHNVSTNSIVCVPCGSSGLYQSASNWSRFKNIIGSMKFNINITPNDASMGSITYLQKHCESDTVIVEAVAKPHYHFLCWNDGIADNPRTIILFQDTVFTAIFAIDTHSVTVLSNDTNMGTVSGSGTYKYNQMITITATPKPDYRFVKWHDGDTNNPRTIRLTQDTVFTAEFSTKNSILQNRNVGTLSLYPNPVQDVLYIDNCEQIINKVEIYNMSGKRIKCIPVNDTKIILSMDDVCQGIYFVNINTKQTNVVRKIRKD